MNLTEIGARIKERYILGHACRLISHLIPKIPGGDTVNSNSQKKLWLKANSFCVSV